MREGDRFFILDIANPSERRVKVSAILIDWGKRSGIYPDLVANRGTPKGLPFVLVPGDSAGCSTTTDELIDWMRSQGARGKVQIRARIVDALGKNYRSRKLSISIPPRIKQ